MNKCPLPVNIWHPAPLIQSQHKCLDKKSADEETKSGRETSFEEQLGGADLDSDSLLVYCE